MTSLSVLQAVKGERAVVTTERLEERRQSNLKYFEPEPEIKSIFKRVITELDRILKKDN